MTATRAVEVKFLVKTTRTGTAEMFPVGVVLNPRQRTVCRAKHLR